MTDIVKSKVASGKYATESEVVRNELSVRDHSIENWLRRDVVPAYQALKTDPVRGVSIDEIRAALAAEHKKATSKA